MSANRHFLRVTLPVRSLRYLLSQPWRCELKFGRGDPKRLGQLVDRVFRRVRMLPAFEFGDQGLVTFGQDSKLRLCQPCPLSRLEERCMSHGI